MQQISKAISELATIEAELTKLDHMVQTLDTYVEDPSTEPKASKKCDGYIKLFDKAGNNPASLSVSHLLHYPEAIAELLALRMDTLKARRDELKDVFSVTTRLLEK